MKTLWASVFLIAFFLMHNARADQSLTLGSGKIVEVVAVGPLQPAQGEPVLMVKYQTSIPLNDTATLRKEVNEVWDRLAIDIDKQGYRQAVISATTSEEGGLIKKSQSYNFVFEKEKQAPSWHMAPANKQGPAKLDEASVREFFDGADWAYEHNEMNAFLLYFADDWAGIFTEDATAPQTADRMMMAASTYKALSVTRDFHHQRKIAKITIAADGSSAQVESDEIEEGILNNAKIRETEHSVDTIEIKNGIPLFAKNTTAMHRTTQPLSGELPHTSP